MFYIIHIKTQQSIKLYFLLFKVYRDSTLDVTTLKESYSVTKLSRASNASHNITVLKAELPFHINYPKLTFHKKNPSGRNDTGRITVFSKGPKLKIKSTVVAYNFRCTALFFIASFNFLPFAKALVSLAFSSTGLVAYLPSRFDDKLFLLSRLTPTQRFNHPLYREILHFKPFIKIRNVPFMLIQQKKNSPISFVELSPLVGSIYARSLGSAASIIKLDSRTGFSLVKLPSGVKKIFSAFSLASAGSANYPILRKQLRSTKCGTWRKRGFKPKVRGVAMNPVDHPHGGRTKAIRYPRTPWGKTTKFK